jgi:hypothetical protein
MSSSIADGRGRLLRLLSATALAAALSGCASSTSTHHLAEQAEQAQDYDRAVVEYTKIVRANPADK